MTDYRQLQDHLQTQKTLFDVELARHPEFTLAEKQARWERFLQRMQPTGHKLRLLENERDYNRAIAEAQEFERMNARELRRLTG